MNAQWKLWLDDQADMNVDGVIIRKTPEGYITAKSSEEAIILVINRGPPEFMDLDCDLGGEDSAMKFLKWMAYSYDCNDPTFDGCAFWPPLYNVHSENCVERLNVVSFMESWRKSL